MVEMQTQHVTPPHRPTYGVHIPLEKIDAIVELALPGYEVISHRELESGKSFNNRIYFIEAVTATSPSSEDVPDVEEHKSLVLKLTGRFWGARKVQNEVGSLLLLQHYCPNVPAPRALAWSEDGKIIRNLAGQTIDTLNPKLVQQSTDVTDASSDYGWILTTRLPGRILTEPDLKGPYGESLLKQVAAYMAAWRTLIPSASVIGNTKFEDSSQSESNDQVFMPVRDFHGQQSPRLSTGGLFLQYRYSPVPLTSKFSYYEYLIEDQLFHLRRSQFLQPLRERIETKVQWLVENLKRLPFLQDTSSTNADIKFTHLDFAPRNILISDPENHVHPIPELDPDVADSHPHVTGILDFEFAGFLPFEDEFIHMRVRQSDDWTTEQYEVLVQELARLGCEVPHVPGAHGMPVCSKQSKGQCSCDSRSFEGLSALAKVTDNVAPWYIQEGSHEGEELQKQCDAAAEAVLSGIEKLNQFLT